MSATASDPLGIGRPELSVVIPAFNEATTVAGVIRSHRIVALDVAPAFEVLACDDGSTDGTWSALEDAAGSLSGVRLLRHRGNLGIAATMKELYAAARGEWIYFAPADGQVPSEALRLMWAAREGAALVVGRRTPRRDPASRVALGRVYSLVLRGLFRVPVHDIDSVKLYRAADLRATRYDAASDFFEAQILIGLCRRGATVREVAIPHRPRIAGRAKGVTRGGALRAARDLALFLVRDLLRSARSR